MKRNRTGYRVEVYWEEFGTLNEGGMMDCRNTELTRKPTKREMTKIKAALSVVLKRLKLTR